MGRPAAVGSRVVVPPLPGFPPGATAVSAHTDLLLRELGEVFKRKLGPVYKSLYENGCVEPAELLAEAMRTMGPELELMLKRGTWSCFKRGHGKPQSHTASRSRGIPLPTVVSNNTTTSSKSTGGVGRGVARGAPLNQAGTQQPGSDWRHQIWPQGSVPEDVWRNILYRFSAKLGYGDAPNLSEKMWQNAKKQLIKRLKTNTPAQVDAVISVAADLHRGGDKWMRNPTWVFDSRWPLLACEVTNPTPTRGATRFPNERTERPTAHVLDLTEEGFEEEAL